MGHREKSEGGLQTHQHQFPAPSHFQQKYHKALEETGKYGLLRGKKKKKPDRNHSWARPDGRATKQNSKPTVLKMFKELKEQGPSQQNNT